MAHCLCSLLETLLSMCHDAKFCRETVLMLHRNVRYWIQLSSWEWLRLYIRVKSCNVKIVQNKYASEQGDDQARGYGIDAGVAEG